MTGKAPPDSIWETDTGQKIAEDNPAFLYNQPTSNLYAMIWEQPERDRAEFFHLLRSNSDGMKLQDGLSDADLLTAAICKSAFRVSPPREGKTERYQLHAAPWRKTERQRLLRIRYAARLKERRRERLRQGL